MFWCVFCTFVFIYMMQYKNTIYWLLHLSDEWKLEAIVPHENFLETFCRNHGTVFDNLATFYYLEIWLPQFSVPLCIFITQQLVHWGWLNLFLWRSCLFPLPVTLSGSLKKGPSSFEWHPRLSDLPLLFSLLFLFFSSGTRISA